MAKERGRRRRPSAETEAALEALFEETVRLYHRLTAAAADIHRDGALSGPRRIVLVGLARTGPQTVAQMARARAQSRQRFQPLVNRLLEDRLVESRPNPAHKQSRLIALTRLGQATVTAIVQTERALRARIKVAHPASRVRLAASVVLDVRRAIEAQLPALLARAPRRRRR